MTRKQKLHALIEELPPRELIAAERYLTYLRLVAQDPVLRAMVNAPLDDEPLSEDDRAALAEARGEVAAGRLLPHEQARRRLLGDS